MHKLLNILLTFGNIERITSANNTYKKVAIQWLNEILCFVLNFVEADSLVLRNPLPLQAPKHW